MLTEWLAPSRTKDQRINECLILIDVVAYAREAPILARLCEETNRSLVVVTNEMCRWAKNHTDLVVHASTRSGLFLESTVAITAALNLIVDAIAKESSSEVADRLQDWKTNARALNLFLLHSIGLTIIVRRPFAHLPTTPFASLAHLRSLDDLVVNSSVVLVV